MVEISNLHDPVVDFGKPKGTPLSKVETGWLKAQVHFMQQGSDFWSS